MSPRQAISLILYVRYTIMQQRLSALTLVEVLLVVVVIGLVVAFLLPMKRTAREAARRNSCMNNLKNITLALYAYADENGTLPPAYTVDDQGNRLHSWRTLILPYMGYASLYNTIDLTKPWDDLVNAKARESIVEAHQCPSSTATGNLTNYLAVVGPDCAFTESEPRKFSDLKASLGNTICIVEVKADRAIPWMCPEDTQPEEVAELLRDEQLNHPGVMIAAFLDGHTRTVSSDMDSESLHGLLTVSKDEKAEP